MNNIKYRKADELDTLTNYDSLGNLESKVNQIIEDRNKQHKRRNLFWRLLALALLLAISAAGVLAFQKWDPQPRAVAEDTTPTLSASGTTSDSGDPSPTPQVVSLERSEPVQDVQNPTQFKWAVTARDRDGNAVPGTNIILEHSANTTFPIGQSVQETTDENGQATFTFSVQDGRIDTELTARVSGSSAAPVSATIPAFEANFVFSSPVLPTAPLLVDKLYEVTFRFMNNSQVRAESVQFHLSLPDGLKLESCENGHSPQTDTDSSSYWEMGDVSSQMDPNVCVAMRATRAGTFEFPATNYWVSYDGSSRRFTGSESLILQFVDYAVADIKLEPTIPYVLPGIDFEVNVTLLDAAGATFNQAATLNLESSHPDLLLVGSVTTPERTVENGTLRLAIPTISGLDTATVTTTLSVPIILTISANNLSEELELPFATVVTTVSENSNRPFFSTINPADHTSWIIRDTLPPDLPVWLLPLEPNSSDQEYREVIVRLWVPNEVVDAEAGSVWSLCLKALFGDEPEGTDPIRGTCVEEDRGYVYVFLEPWADLDETWILGSSSNGLYKDMLAKGWVKAEHLNIPAVEQGSP